MPARKLLELRPNVSGTEQVMALINSNRCWHFDAWLMRTSDRKLYYREQTRRSGRAIITDLAYVVLGEGAGAMDIHPIPTIPDGAQAITMHDKPEWPNFDVLNDLHWNVIRPRLARRPSGFVSQSVAFHYVRAPSLDPFGFDAINLSHHA